MPDLPDAALACLVPGHVDRGSGCSHLSCRVGTSSIRSEFFNGFLEATNMLRMRAPSEKPLVVQSNGNSG